MRFLLTGLAVDAGNPASLWVVMKRAFLPWLLLEYTFPQGVSSGG